MLKQLKDEKVFEGHQEGENTLKETLTSKYGEESKLIYDLED